jgi:hypothetical protein
MRIYIKILILLIILIILATFINFNNILEYFNNHKYTAVIVEPREHKALELVLQNFLENLSDNWYIIIMHGNKNINYLNNIIDNKFSKYKYRIILVNLNVDNLSIDEYNKLLVSEEFYKNIPTEIFLIFQTDSIICENNKELIYKYLKYDYVGAPWAHHNNNVGNGGLSLRKKSYSIKKIKECEYDGIAEDLYFTSNCVEPEKPDFIDAKNFSIESIYSETSFGVHKPWGYLNNDELDNLKNKCKNLDKLIELNT